MIRESRKAYLKSSISSSSALALRCLALNVGDLGSIFKDEFEDDIHIFRSRRQIIRIVII